MARGFLLTCDDTDAKINKHIHLKDQERATTILASIFSMIKSKMSIVKIKEMRSDFDTVCKIENKLSRHIPFESNTAVEFVIENALKDRKLALQNN